MSCVRTDFGATPGSCADVSESAVCAYVAGGYSSSGNYQGYGFLQVILH